MPFYEYECAACRYYVEVLQKISDAPLKKCPSCGKQQLKRLISAPVFRLKGSGWYETDFKSDKENKRNLAGAEAAPADTKAAETKASDAKADAKPETKSDTATAKPESAGKPATSKRSSRSTPGKRASGTKRSAPRAAARGKRR